MQKLKEMLKQLGATPELMESFTKELQAYKDTLDKEFGTRLDAAKQICLEEVQAEKKNLSRKIEIFLESRITTINREAQKQAAIGESESVKMLKGIKSLLEGITNDAPTDNQANTEVRKLRVLATKLQEERDNSTAAAKRANAIAQKALQRCKVLESKIQTKNTVAENKTPAQKPLLESIRVQSAEPKTTRPVVTENKHSMGIMNGNPDIMNIANGLDGTPAFVTKQ